MESRMIWPGRFPGLERRQDSSWGRVCVWNFAGCAWRTPRPVQRLELSYRRSEVLFVISFASSFVKTWVNRDSRTVGVGCGLRFELIADRVAASDLNVNG